jgi:hypothetical protein
MKKYIYVIALALTLFIAVPSTGQSKETLKSIMANSWVKKYKKLKTDLEEKAYFVKNMENISESDLKTMEQSYKKTSKLLDKWLVDFAASMDEKKENIVLLSEGSINNDLKEELFEIFTIYSNDFTTKYEDITGLPSKSVLSHEQLRKDELTESNGPVSFDKINKSFLMANVVPSLKPSAWNKIY